MNNRFKANYFQTVTFADAYMSGKLLIEQRMGIMTFRLLGKNYSSNINRSRPYSFSSNTWTMKDISFIDKCLMVYNGTMKRIG